MADRPLARVHQLALDIYWANEQPKVEPMITKLLEELFRIDPLLDYTVAETVAADG